MESYIHLAVEYGNYCKKQEAMWEGQNEDLDTKKEKEYDKLYEIALSLQKQNFPAKEVAKEMYDERRYLPIGDIAEMLTEYDICRQEMDMMDWLWTDLFSEIQREERTRNPK